MKRIINYNKEARESLKKGVDAVADAVSVTLGPKGRNVVIDRGDHIPTQITKDGVTVAREVYPDNPTENTGAKMIKEVATQTVDDAGDGTTTATVLAQSIIRVGFEMMEKDCNPVLINRGVELATNTVVEALKAMSTPIKDKGDLAKVATISTNNDKELGSIIGEAMDAVGEDGLVVTEFSRTPKTYWEKVAGTRLNSPFITHNFINNSRKMSCELEYPAILITKDKITKISTIENVMRSCMRQAKPLLIVCNDMEGEAIVSVIQNTMAGNIKACVVTHPGIGDFKDNLLDDLAFLTGTDVFSDNFGTPLSELAELHPDKVIKRLGTCERIESTSKHTTFVESAASESAVKSRVADLKLAMKKFTSEDDIRHYKDRMAKLSGSIGVIYLGAKTDIVLGEKKDRLDDAVGATYAAREEGIVPGGGVALIRCIRSLEKLKMENKDEAIGLDIVKASLVEPLRKILENSGSDISILDKVIEGSGNFGWDAKKERYEDDMIKAGIIDPTKVTRCAMENAADIAGHLLTTECLIVDITEYHE